MLEVNTKYMPSRLKYIKTKFSEKKRIFKPLKYPDIPLSIEDIYVTTTVGDRLDSLAYQFYNDVDLWWIIVSSNPNVVRRDSFNLKPGLEIRIPANIQFVIEEFERINK